ncbi:hypothetical protein [Actinoplanes teichomyceticus]|uniref:Uncharacterized protein n=1 Tax=Actinoplanes teichomyceticus TaxID=1867 RepID=A0A561VMH7_ACTTI|nr:hypothetical protein [Actinoplanes teichomyceticus]TWG12802.1 hypothetical protein FHX34_105670 [Actinoplanes teichomyceticus]GIF13542.1 hypothetical protein Ate01nite_35740 [Actinoplanes teichomyceticus]
MPTIWILIAVSPLLVTAGVLAAVTMTALIRARPEDVPAVTSTFATAFTKLVERVRIGQRPAATLGRVLTTGPGPQPPTATSPDENTTGNEQEPA